MKTVMGIYQRPVAGAALRQARTDSGLSVRELARRAGTSHPTILAYERGDKVPSVNVFFRLLQACGYAVNLDLERRIREADGMDRGDELRQVLELAEQFPARVDRYMTSPTFGARRAESA